MQRRDPRYRRQISIAAAAYSAIEALEGRSLLSATLTPSADADVETQTADVNYANANFGADTQLRVNGDANDTIETYVTFNISSVPSIGSASVSLVGGSDPNASQITTDEISVYAAGSTTWVEGNGVQPVNPPAGLNEDNNPPGEIRWNNRPGSTGAALDVQSVDLQSVYSWDVTSYVQAQKAAGATSISLVFRSTGGTGLSIFESKEAVDTPVLNVDDDTTAPTAAVSASNITTSGGATESIAVTYTDDAGLNSTSIDTGDISITGPGGALSVTGVSVDATNPKSVIATYTVAAPGGTWDGGDNGSYAVAVQAGQVTDLGGNGATGSGSFTVNIPTDVTPPIASSFNAQNITAAGSATYTFTVGYTDDVSLNASSITAGTVSVVPTGGGTPLTVTGITRSGTGAAINATYTVSAPGGTWDSTDNGSYTITVLAGGVKDAANNGIAATTHTFQVSVPDTNSPGLTITPIPNVTTAGVTTTLITVTYTDNQGIAASTIDSSDLSVVEDGGAALAVTLLSKSPSTNAASIIAVYSVAAPGGFWNSTDNGSYTVAIAPGAVLDTSGNPTPLGGATFEVDIPSTTPVADPTFNGGNPVNTGFVAEAMVPDATGRILVAGRQGDRAAGTSQSVLQRLNADGSLDTFFGQGGQIIANPGDNDGFFAVTTDEKQRIVAAGFRAGELEVVRYDSKGRLDKHFGTGGVAEADLGGTDDTGYAINALPGGALLVAGTSNGAFALAKFTSKGRLDPTFGSGGVKSIVTTSGAAALGALAVRPDGTIIAAGTQGSTVVLVKLDRFGNVDTTFGTNGVLTVTGLGVRTGLGVQDHTVGLAVYADGRILVGNGTASGNFGLRRLNADGTPDNTLDGDSLATVDFGGADDVDFVGLQGTGQIILAGTTDAGSGTQLAVAGLTSSGALDGNFSAGGKFTVDNAVVADAGTTGALTLHVNGMMQPNGRVLLSVGEATAKATSSPLRRLIVPGSGIVGSFGTINGKRTKLTFLDGDGTKVTFSLSGGVGQALYDGSDFDLILTGTSTQSSLGISAKGGDKRVLLRDLHTDGPMKSISAKTTDVVGTFYVNGAAAKVAVGTLGGTLAAAGPISSLSIAGNASGAFILSGVSLGSDFKIGGSGAAADTYAAGRIAKLAVGGSMTSVFVGAGVNPINSVFGDSDDSGVDPLNSAISSISVKRGLDTASLFEAGVFSKAKIPQTVNPLLDSHFKVLTA